MQYRPDRRTRRAKSRDVARRHPFPAAQILEHFGEDIADIVHDRRRWYRVVQAKRGIEAL